VNRVLDMVKGKARAAGSFLGGLANNPAIVIIALVLGGLIIFKDQISKAVGGLGAAAVEGIGDINIQLPEIKFPEFTFPEFKFPELPEIQFPTLPTLPNIFGDDTIPQPQKMVENTGLLPDPNICECGSSIVQDAFGNVNQTCKSCQQVSGIPKPDPVFEGGIGDPNFLDFLGLTPAQMFAADKGGFVVPASDPFGLGGGEGFIGGKTTFGDSGEIVDTLSEVLSIFPNLTASQAADALTENVGLTKNEFAQVDPDIINISSAGIDPAQIFLNASGGFSGLSAEDIVKMLTGGNISNF